MSHVTCHMSHVTCHMSRVTCRMSPITCHMSHVTCHMSPITCHMSRVACHMSHVACGRCSKPSCDGFQPTPPLVHQNQLEVARYLVERHGVDATQLNFFACGAQHWLGTAPPERAGHDGEALLPMAKWLQEQGVDWLAAQRQVAAVW